MSVISRLALTCTLAASGLLLACGGDDDEPVTTSPPPPKQDGQAKPPPVGNGEGGVTLTQIGDFNEPVYIAQPPGQKRDLFVVERDGAIRVIRDGKVRPKPFLDINDQVDSETLERGLLSIAFPADYQRSGIFYIYYTDNNGDIHIAEMKRSANDPLVADTATERTVLTIEHSQYENHNGGLLQFGPDGFLYAGVGDGGGGDDQDRRGQDLTTLLGKMLRIDPTPQGGRPYGIPEDNPFLDTPGARPEIYQYGLRNPWRYSFDPANDAMVIGDVGQNEVEEVDYLPRGEQSGANLGWSAFEGENRFNEDQQAPGAIPPILTYPLYESGECAITGGYVVRDLSLRSLYGRYLYGDHCAGWLRSFIPDAKGARDDKDLGESVSMVSSFGVDLDGHIYAASLEGPVYRLDPAAG